jgi:DNA-binding NarL/FixJ family response regulator
MAGTDRDAIVTIRLVLAEDSYLVRQGVRRLVESHPDLELVGECDTLDGLLTTVDDTHPDVVLTDIRMPPTGTDEGIQAAARFHSSHPDMGVVVLSQFTDPAYALLLLEHGSSGRAYLLKERLSDPEQLLVAIREVVRGGSVIDPAVVDVLVAARSQARRSPLALLTGREQEVLAAMAEGKNNAGIASALVLSERAVEKHINSIFSKLGLSEEPDVHRRVKAVLVFLSTPGVAATS